MCKKDSRPDNDDDDDDDDKNTLRNLVGPIAFDYAVLWFFLRNRSYRCPHRGCGHHAYPLRMFAGGYCPDCGWNVLDHLAAAKVCADTYRPECVKLWNDVLAYLARYHARRQEQSTAAAVYHAGRYVLHLFADISATVAANARRVKALAAHVASPLSHRLA